MSGFIEEIGNNEIDNGEPMMHGGAKLSVSWRTENKIDAQTPFFWKDKNKAFLRGVLHMLEMADKIECISYKSLYAFVFVINVPTNLKNNTFPFSSIIIGESRTNEGDKPVTKLILKMSLLVDDNNKYLAKLFLQNTQNQLYNSIEKGVDTVDGFKEEVQTQIKVFEKTWKKGKLANCPSIVFDEAFETKDSLLFLNYLLTVFDYKLTNTSKRMLIYLHDVITRQPVLRLGFIAMEYAEKFTIFDAYYHNLKITENNISDTLTGENINTFLDSNYSKLLRKTALIFANMLVLYFNGYVHCDLHTNNVFVIGDNVTGDNDSNANTIENACNDKKKLLSDSKYSCIRIIDFGRVSEKNPEIPMDYFQNLIFKINNNDTIVQDIMLDKEEYNDTKNRNIYQSITGLFKKILFIFMHIYNTDLLYNQGKINPTTQIPQCFIYFQLLKFIRPTYVKPITKPPRIQTLTSDFFIFDNKFVITNITEVLQYSNDQKYVIALIIQYLITYTDSTKIIVEKEPAKTSGNMYKGSQEEENKTADENFEQSFQGQLLRFQLEQLKTQLDFQDKDQHIEPIAVKSYQLDDDNENGKKRFDLFDTNGSIRTKEPGLEVIFQSIDDIIGMK